MKRKIDIMPDPYDWLSVPCSHKRIVKKPSFYQIFHSTKQEDLINLIKGNTVLTVILLFSLFGMISLGGLLVHFLAGG